MGPLQNNMKVMKVCEHCVQAFVAGAEMGCDPEVCRNLKYWTLTSHKYDDLKSYQQSAYRTYIYNLQSPPPRPPETETEGRGGGNDAPGASPKSYPSGRIVRPVGAAVTFGLQVGLGAGCKFPSASASLINVQFPLPAATPWSTVLFYALVAVLLSFGAYELFRAIQLRVRRHSMVLCPDSCENKHSSPKEQDRVQTVTNKK